MWLSSVPRILAALAGLIGAAGIAGAALAAHGGYDENLRTASQFALIHAALVAALCLATTPTRTTILAAGVVLAGAGLFCGDLALRALKGHSLFPMAAPTGGSLLIAGWLLLSLAAVIRLPPK
ncbi:MAG: hypothetical protein JWM36_1618 [Hyphomicrobiales bacterium]|jgi:uncharacterized membrane protein YgdD (TMEM256/DUF423 family)|nr:hypothetical protein [Hyphomicrobiales bacterium]